MTPLVLFLLAGAAVYLGAIEASFSALMRLSLRLLAERSDRPDELGKYLDDPLLLFVPVRLLLAFVTAAATVFVARVVAVDQSRGLVVVLLAMAGFVVFCEMLLPLLIVGRDPERVLGLLLPSFAPVARALGPMTRWIARAVAGPKRAPAPSEEEAEDTHPPAAPGEATEETRIDGEERRLLQSIVDFGDTLVREVMTPRPDIVAIRDAATVGDLRALFREQEYSRFPVYKESLDNIAGFVFVKDLVARDVSDDASPITPLLRPAVVVPETKLVPELLKQFQRQQTQCAIVVDEYGGTAGLVTIEDLLEEIVGEIRDEYDVESESVVDEGNGWFAFSGKVDVDEVSRRLNVHIEREGFETVGGYLLAHLGRVPMVGDRFEMDGLSVEVLDAERRRITKVRITKLSTTEDTEDTEVKSLYGMKSGFVSFIGRPNAGKSTLLNRIVGTKLAIVSDKPQTTRTRILGVKNYPDAQVVFVDTPGIHRPLHRMNVRMVDAAVDTIREVDLIGLVVDAAEPPGRGDRFVLDLVRQAKAPVLLILNKIDLVRKTTLLPIMARFAELGTFAEIVPLSASTGDNVDRLEQVVLGRLPEGERLYPDDYITDQPERVMAAEIVREKLLLFTHAELPFSTAVVVDRFEEPEPAPGPAAGRAGLLRLHCTIVVDRASQKPIVVGKGGEMIKKIGTAAREDLERFFSTRVFLDLHVRVKSDWREDERVLDDIGVK